MTQVVPQEIKLDVESTSNRMKEWLAREVINAFALAWKVVQRCSRRKLPVKQHYYTMKLFRFLFRSYYVWICYPNPLAPQQALYLRVNLCENNQQWYFRLRSQYELTEIQLIAEAMRNAEVFVDVGANIGVYAVTIAQAFPDKQVIAFEPLSTNFDSLIQNITCNILSNCTAYQQAVSNAGKPARFYINPIHDGGGSLTAPSVYKTGDVEIDVKRYQQEHPEWQPWVEVETTRLDEVISCKSVVKIDVEGSEVDVLQSMVDALKTGLVDLMIVEVLQETVDEVVQLMDEVSFDSFLLPDCTPIATEARLPWFVKNIVCVRKNTPEHNKIAGVHENSVVRV